MRLTIPLLLLIAGLSACKKDDFYTDAALAIIPGNSVLVVRADLPVLLEKADFESVRKGGKFREAVGKAREKNPALAQAMENPEQSGIDLGKPAYYFTWINPENHREQFNGFTVSLADAVQLETLLGAEQEVKSSGGMRYVLLDIDKIAAWTDEVALFGFASALTDLLGRAEQIFKTKPAESAAASETLQDAFADEHDLAFWVDFNPLAGAPEAQLGASFAELDPESLKNNRITGHLDFLEGLVEGVAKFSLNKKLSRELEKLFNDEVDDGFEKYVPAEGLVLLLTSALNIGGIAELINVRKQARGLTDFSLLPYGITLDDIVETFSGDIVLAAAGAPEGGEKVGLFAARVKDEERLQKFLELGVEREALLKEREGQYKILETSFGKRGESFTITFDDGAPRLLAKDGYLFVCGDEQWIYHLENGGFPSEQRIRGEALKNSGGSLFSLYMGARAFNPESRGVSDISLKVRRDRAIWEARMQDEGKNALRSMLE